MIRESTAHVVSKPVNWLINVAILVLIVTGYVANREGDFNVELTAGVTLVLLMAITVVYGVFKLRMQMVYDAHCPPRRASITPARPRPRGRHRADPESTA